MNRRVEKKTIVIGLFLTRMEVAIAIMRMMNRGRRERNIGGGGGVKGVDTHRIGYGKRIFPTRMTASTSMAWKYKPMPWERQSMAAGGHNRNHLN